MRNRNAWGEKTTHRIRNARRQKAIYDVVAWMAFLQRQFDPEALETGQLDNYALFQTWAAVFPADYLYMFTDIRWINDPSAQTMIPAPELGLPLTKL